jgi:arylsulfatase A-like enzyme
VDREGLGEQLDIFLISDHGHSTVQAQGSLQGHLQRAIEALGLQSGFITTGNYLHAPEGEEPSDRDVAALVEWLQVQEWCNLVFAGPPKYQDLPGVLPLEHLLGPITHSRAPLLAIQPKWNNEVNEFGVPGTIQALTSSPIRSTHGTMSPYDIHAFCLGVGGSFKQGYVSDIPCGIVDIAPTVCHLIGLRTESGFDGRVLAEAFSPELADEGLKEHEISEVSKIRVDNGCKDSQGLTVVTVNGTKYISGC